VGGDPHEAALNEVRVIVPSRDLPRRVDGKRKGALGGRGGREIERGEGTVAGPSEAVIQGRVCVNIACRDRARRGDAGR
jgi:hypothetical protein